MDSNSSIETENASLKRKSSTVYSVDRLLQNATKKANLVQEHNTNIENNIIVNEMENETISNSSITTASNAVALFLQQKMLSPSNIYLKYLLFIVI